MNSKDFYTVKINGVDKSLNVKDFTTAGVSLALLTGEYLHIGYYKPFRQFYAHFSTLNIVNSDITVEYYDGTTWKALDTLIDETNKFLSSGFMHWQRPTDWEKVEVDSDELYYLRISFSADLTAGTVLQGLNVLFSNDADLIGVRSNIVSKHNNGNPWIEKHEEARKYIIQRLRNLGYRKVKVDETSPLFFESKEDSTTYSNLTQFDLLEPFELREAAKYYALANIYLDELSDEADDKYERAGLRHERKADEALNVFMLKVDRDDDGEEDPEENEGDTGINLLWE